jgi:hypothetical protein
MTVPAPKLSPLPAAMIALAFAAATSAEAEDGKRIHMSSHTAATAQTGPAVAMTQWASTIAFAGSSSIAIDSAAACDRGLSGMQAALDAFRLASVDYVASAAKLSAVAWSNVHAVVLTASLIKDDQPVSAAAIARVSHGAQAVFDGLLTVTDLVAGYAWTAEEIGGEATVHPSSQGIAASYASASAAVTRLRQSFAERLDWARITQSMDDLSHDVMAVIGPSETRAAPRTSAFIQIKAANDALADLRTLTAPDIDVLAITNMEILRLAGRGL